MAGTPRQVSSLLEVLSTRRRDSTDGPAWSGMAEPVKFLYQHSPHIWSHGPIMAHLLWELRSPLGTASMRSLRVLHLAIVVSVAFCFSGCKPDHNQVFWGIEGNSPQRSTNGYFTHPDKYPSIGFVQLHYDPQKTSPEKVIETGMTLCRSDFEYGFHKGLLIEWGTSDGVQSPFSPKKVVFILLPMDSDDRQALRTGTTYVVRSNELFGDRPISEVIDQSEMSQEGYRLDMTSEYPSEWFTYSSNLNED